MKQTTCRFSRLIPNGCPMSRILPHTMETMLMLGICYWALPVQKMKEKVLNKFDKADFEQEGHDL